MRRIAHLILLAAGAATTGGCSGLTAEQRTWLTEGQRAYESGQYALAVRRLSQFLDSAGGRPEADRALYIRGLSHARDGRRPAAYADLAEAARRADDPDVRWRAEFALGELYFEDQNWEAARRAYASAVEHARPAYPTLERGLYRLAICAQRAGNWDEGVAYLRRLVGEFPRGAAAQAARRILDAHPDAFSIQCGAFARPENAETRVRELERAGFAAEVRRERREDGVLNVVHVGRYRTYDEAQAALARVRAHVRDAVIWP